MVPASRRTIARGAVLLLVLVLLAPAAVSAATHDSSTRDLRTGNVTEPAEGITVVSIQGFKFQDQASPKKPARLAAFGPRGEPLWVYNGSTVGANWFYDVDPLPNGNLLVTAAEPGGTIVMSLDPATRSPVWIERLPFHDTHDADLINGDQLLIANMRNYDETTGRNDDRLLIYNRTTDEIVWEWLFRDHYPADGGGDYRDDWTHVNDVDRVGPGRYLASVRNFDQVIVVNRSTGAIDLRLGEDGRLNVLYEQHNPQYLESRAGNPVVLVADSESDRIVEYERINGTWERTWQLGSSASFAWPRDADRLPNGNTLVTDSINHRVIEVTPTGEIVWEVYAPWGPYDAERVVYGDEASNVEDLPAISDLGARGQYPVTGSAGLVPGTGGRLSFAQRLTRTFAGTPIAAEVDWFAARWAHVTPWIYPVWMNGWGFAGVVAAALIVVVWVGTEAFMERRRIATVLRRRVP